MSTVLPREEAVEAIFTKILSSKEACERLGDVFKEHLNEENYSGDSAENFAEILLRAYKNGDVSAVLLELCGKSMFDLLREAYLIPKKFHGKAGENPVLLTDVKGNLLQENKVSAREYAKFQEIFKHHNCAPRSKIYLADGYDMVRYFTKKMDVEEKKENRSRGVLILYALPDTCRMGLSEAEAYAVIWETFREIQKMAPRAIVYYGQETGIKKEKEFDEIGVLLPIREFEKKMLHHLQEIDGIVLSCREKMMERAGNDSLDLN